MHEFNLAWHRYVLMRMRDDRSLYMRAEETLEQWLSADEPQKINIAAWQAAFSAGFNAVYSIATDPSEVGNAVRQCSPLTHCLSEEERLAFASQWVDDPDSSR